MAIELVTGRAGSGHVSSADVGRFNAGICGTDKYVLTTGLQFEYTIVSANEITIASGDAVDQGRHIIIPQNTTESAIIETGTQGKTRIDVIALRYSKATVDGNTVESASLVVVKGTEVDVGSSPEVPALIRGNIFNGDSADDMPLYCVIIRDLNISSVTKVFRTLPPLGNIVDLLYPIGAIYISTNSANPSSFFGGQWQEIKGRVLLGRSTGHAAGTTGGAESVVLTKSQLPAHEHDLPSHSHSVPNHQHTVPAHTHNASASNDGAHTHKVAHAHVGAQGNFSWSAAPHTSNLDYDTSVAGEHTHEITVDSKAAFNTTNSGACTTTAEAGTSGSVGSGAAVDTMPPYLAVYMWKRTA